MTCLRCSWQLLKLPRRLSTIRSCAPSTVTGSGHTVQALPIERTVEILKKYGAIASRDAMMRILELGLGRLRAKAPAQP